jgi:hypothetical protein
MRCSAHIYSVADARCAMTPGIQKRTCGIWTTWGGRFRSGREPGHPSVGSRKKDAVEKMPEMSQSFPITVAKGTLHCGSGCDRRHHFVVAGICDPRPYSSTDGDTG